jgi:hypothetical protein
MLPQLSPNRSLMVFATSQWSPRGADDLDIAIADSLGGGLRALTTGPTSDTSPTWDPSGTRIAFIRKHRVIRPDELCVVTLEGTLIACHTLAGFDANAIGGWLDPNSLVLVGLGNQGPRAMRLDLQTGALGTFVAGRTLQLELSPNARWTLCRCDLLESEEPEWRLFPTRDPTGARSVQIPEGHTVMLLSWSAVLTASERAISSLRIANLPEAIPLETTHRPRAEAFNSAGRAVPIPPGVLRWWSADSGVARVDSVSGTVTPVREGNTTIHVSAGGWRTMDTPVTVRGHPYTMVLDEAWRMLSPTRWHGYGEPRPRLATGPGGIRGLVPNGDGSNPSGLYSEPRWAAREGIGVEVDVSTPIDRTNWQSLGLALSPDTQDSSLAHWDHITGSPMGDQERNVRTCALGYPGSEGGTGVDRIAVAAGENQWFEPVPPVRRTGEWWQLRLQIFPDGSCGIAVNGNPRWRSTPRLSPRDPYRLWLSGHAVGTEPMFGRVQVWTGVRPDVNWAALDSIPPD